MGKYVQQSLVSGEQVISEARVTPWIFLPYLLLALLLPFLFPFIAIPLIRYLTTELALTNYRVIAKYGFIRRTTVELNLNKLESLQVTQGILGRLLNYGTITVAGAGLPQAPLRSISNPMAFRRSLMEYRNHNLQNEKTSTSSKPPIAV